jgi:MraZ protein
MEEKDTAARAGGGEVPGVFVGSYTHALDPKKRFTIPAVWRDQLGRAGSLFVLPAVYERCLYVFPSPEMARRLERIRGHSISDTKARQFMRALASRSDLVTWDTQGRIRIKDELLEYAQVTTHVVLVGAFVKFELWAPDLWKVSGSVDQATLDDAARYVGF